MKVRVKLRFRGRQKAHKEFGFEVVNRFVREAAPYGQADTPPKMLGDRDLNVLLSPLPREKRAPRPGGEPKPGSAPKSSDGHAKDETSSEDAADSHDSADSAVEPNTEVPTASDQADSAATQA